MHGLDDAVLNGFEHRLQRGNRRSKVVTGPGDKLAPCVERFLEVGCHEVERCSQLRQLRRAALWGPGTEVARGQALGSGPDVFERVNEVAS